MSRPVLFLAPPSGDQTRHELLERKIGLATVYRVLHALTGAGLVRAFSREGELA